MDAAWQDIPGLTKPLKWKHNFGQPWGYRVVAPLLVDERLTWNARTGVTIARSSQHGHGLQCFALYIGFTPTTTGPYALQIADHGVGLPQNFNLASVESLGFQLITALTHQLRGRMLLDQESCFARGTCVCVEINLA